MPDKKYFITGITIIIVLILGSIGFLFFESRTTSNAFVGNLSHVEGNTIFVKGQFYTNKKTYLPEGGKSIDEEIVVIPATKFKRTALRIPIQEELEKTGGRFMVNDLKKDISNVGFETFKKDAKESLPISLEVASVKNIWGKSRFEAQEITYRLAIYPEQ